MIIPFDLKENSNVLISGCGGGFDIVVGIPLALELESRGHNVFFSSFTFTRLENAVNLESISDMLSLVTENTYIPEYRAYFPESHMIQWLKGEGKTKNIYCYSQTTVRETEEIFNFIKKENRIDSHFVVDGGSDGIFRGDEYGLGSPLIDAISIIAASRSKIRKKVYVLSAFGTEGVNNEVSHADVLERMAELVKKNSLLGISSIENDKSIKKKFLKACDYLNKEMDTLHSSTIVGSIQAALEGKFGYQSYNSKTKIHPVWISPLTSVLWYFDLKPVADLKLFKNELIACDEYFESSDKIWKYWNDKKERPVIPI